MANGRQAWGLKRNVKRWNQWRRDNPRIKINLTYANLRCANLRCANLSDADLSGADLTGANFMNAHLAGADLTGADFRNAHLTGANLMYAYIRGTVFRDADLMGADFRNADLTGANLSGANLTDAYLLVTHLIGVDLTDAHLTGADLTGADLTDAHLRGADLRSVHLIVAYLTGVDLTGADLSRAILRGADLSQSVLVRTIMTKADISGAKIYGVSVWDVQADGAIQNNLVISDVNEPVITVDDLEVAQFIYLLLNNHKLRKVISTMAHKAVLILGRFTDEHLPVLNAIRDTLRARDYLPILFDFEKAPERDYTETVVALAHLCRFVIADLTDPRSIQQELTAFVPTLEIPVQPIIEQPQKPWTMFSDFRRKYHWVLAPL